MNHPRLLQRVIFVILSMILSLGCVAPLITPVAHTPAVGTETPKPTTPTPVAPTATSLPATATVAALPSTSSGGALQGKVIGAKDQKPAADVAIILCLIVAEKKCAIKANLVAKTKTDGSFELTDVLPGSYVLLHSLPGKARDSYKDIDGAEVGIDIGAPGIVFASGEIQFEKEEKITTAISKDGGVVLNLFDDKPTTVDIQRGKIIESVVKIFAFDVIDLPIFK